MTTKKRRPCPSCGAAFQVGAIVWRMLPSGPQRQRVCQRCAALALPVLAVDAPCRCEECGEQLARFCGGCVARVISRATGRGVRALVESSLTKAIAPTKSKRGVGAQPPQ